MSASKVQGMEVRDLDPRDQAAYTVAEAARYLRLPAATLRSWVVGRPYPKAKELGHFEPLIHPPASQPPTLSFWNLIEAHVLRSLRTHHGVSIQAVRQALEYAEQCLNIRRLLLREELRTDAGRIFLDRYGELIDLSSSGQLAMRQMLQGHLRRIDWDEAHLPTRLHPFLTGESSDSRGPIVIDARIAFGRPVLTRSCVSTATIAERIDAHESVTQLAEDYGLTRTEIEQAVLFERAA